MNTINWLYLSDCFGVVVFAISGALAAGRRSMDIFGVLVIAFITALGGGTLRDLLLGMPRQAHRAALVIVYSAT